MLGTENAQLCSKTGSKRQGRLETGVKRVVEFKMGAGAFEQLETLGNDWGRSEMVGNTSERVVVFESESECPKTTENACKHSKMGLQ